MSLPVGTHLWPAPSTLSMGWKPLGRSGKAPARKATAEAPAATQPQGGRSWYLGTGVTRVDQFIIGTGDLPGVEGSYGPGLPGLQATLHLVQGEAQARGPQE